MARPSLFGLCALGICTSGTFGAQFDVYPGQSIQGAIDGASDGDVIIVHPGTYAESISFDGKAITLRSTEPEEPAIVGATIIDSSGLETSTVKFFDGETDQSVVDGLTIRGGVGSTMYTAEPVGGGVFCYAADPVIRRCVIEGNEATGGGGVFAKFSDITIEHSWIRDNHAWAGQSSIDGGGGINLFGGSPTVVGCVIEGNSASIDGGGITIRTGDSTILNCLIRGNESALGGGICSQQGSCLIAECTIIDNVVDAPATYGGGVRADLGTLTTLRNCVVWGNTSLLGPSEVRESADASAIAQNCCIRYGWWGEGSGNIGEDLETSDVFLDFDNGNFRLLDTSPCVNAGTAAAETLHDLDGNLRLVGAAVDMGAYELQSVPPPPVPTGACCLGAVCSVLSFDECAASGGLYQGDDAPCGGDTCVVPDPTGACCADDGTCAVMSESDCIASGGDYAGDDLACIDASCPQPPPPGGEGACCFSNGFCLVAEAEMCIVAGGTYLGDGTICSGSDPCGGGGEPEPCPGDLDGSAEVEFFDLLLLLDDWGECPGCAADLDGNDDVGMTDLVEMLAVWGPCPS